MQHTTNLDKWLKLDNYFGGNAETVQELVSKYGRDENFYISTPTSIDPASLDASMKGAA